MILTLVCKIEGAYLAVVVGLIRITCAETVIFTK